MFLTVDTTHLYTLLRKGYLYSLEEIYDYF